MVTINRVLRDTGTTPERFVFIFEDETVVSVVDTEKLPYHTDPEARFEASLTKESFIESGEVVEANELPDLCELASSVGESTHTGQAERVPDKYIRKIQDMK